MTYLEIGTRSLQRVLNALPQMTLETPAFIFDSQECIDTITALIEALGGPLILSLKANPSVDLQIRLHHIPVGIEVSSLAELNVAIKTPELYVNTPAMDKNLIRAAIGAKATMIVDSLAQLDDILALKGRREVAPLMLRLNATVLHRFADGTPIPAFREDQFGLDWDDALTLIRKIRDTAGALTLAGFHLYAGSHTWTRLAPTIAALAPKIHAEMEKAWGGPLSSVNLGGGFSETWRSDRFDFAAYRAALMAFPDHVRILHESGRGVFSGCGYFVTQVLRTKVIGDRHFAVCDGGLNQCFLLCRTENALRKPRTPLLVRARPASEDPDVVTTLVGNSCSRDDVIGQVSGPPLNPGDLCVFDQTGAYHSTYTVSKFLGLKEAVHYVL